MQKGIEQHLFRALSRIIESGKQQLAVQVNSALTLVFWQVGDKINRHILDNQRAAYGKQTVSTVSAQLESKFGRSFNEKNVRRMMQFAEVYCDFQIVVSLSRQLSWSHFMNLIPLKNAAARAYYAERIAEGKWSIRETRKQISKKAFERNEIANTLLDPNDLELKNAFKEPYLLDFLGLKDGYLENDLEAAILKELENFILELGEGFAFVERQKRMIIDGEDFYLDLLFYHRRLSRLVAIELKLGKFKAAHKGQMELYLKWLNKHERQASENNPIGLILCTEKSKEQVELLEVHKEGIIVAEYWTELPAKKALEQKLQQIYLEAKERISKKKLLEPKATS